MPALETGIEEKLLRIDLLSIAEAIGDRVGVSLKSRSSWRLISSSRSSVRVRLQGFAPLGGRCCLPAGSGERSRRNRVMPNKLAQARPARSRALIISGRGGNAKWLCAFGDELVLLLPSPLFIEELFSDVVTGVCAIDVGGVGTVCVGIGPDFVVGVVAIPVVGVAVTPDIDVAVERVVGVAVGVAVGAAVGVAVGDGVGVAVGDGVGVAVGDGVAVAVGDGVAEPLISGVVTMLSTADRAGAAYELMLTHRNERTSNRRQSATAIALMDVVWFMSCCILVYYPEDYNVFTVLKRW